MMRKLLSFLFIFLGCSLLLNAQKSKVVAVFQLVETDKLGEAKKAIEEAITDERTQYWPRTWYARGYLCQTAYEKGINSKDKKKYELYPDQLYVAYESYEKALKLDKRGRYDAQLAPLYVQLANNFQVIGEKHFRNKKYEDAFKAYETSLKINQSPVLSIKPDKDLIYNTALAAYEMKNWDKASRYLGQLNKAGYSPNVPHLLYLIYMEQSDTVSAEGVLRKGIHQYKDNENLVLLLADLLFNSNQPDRAVEMLDSITLNNPKNYIFPYTKGLIYQKTEQYEKAIQAYESAISLSPDETRLYASIGLCYYNIGAGFAENARTIKNNSDFRLEKAKSAVAYKNAIVWLEKAQEKEPDDQDVILKLYQLYKILGITDKIQSLEGKLK